MILDEDSLQASDLKYLVSHVFEIDSYKSKMGDDEDVVVLSFSVDNKDVANDLVSFVEKGYKAVLDADMSPGEMSNNRYLVFIELDRNRHLVKVIMDILYGIKKLADIDEFKFRYYKSFNSIVADEHNLSEKIPLSPKEYLERLEHIKLENYTNFFDRSLIESIQINENDIIEFRRIYSEPITMKVLNSGPTNILLKDLTESVSLGISDMSEVFYLTKCIGNYNITKYDTNKFIFENRQYSVILEKI